MSPLMLPGRWDVGSMSARSVGDRVGPELAGHVRRNVRLVGGEPPSALKHLDRAAQVLPRLLKQIQ